VIAGRVLGGVGVKGFAAGFEEQDILVGLVRVGGVLPVYINTIKAPICGVVWC
jgi:hypothetical protein